MTVHHTVCWTLVQVCGLPTSGSLQKPYISVISEQIMSTLQRSVEIHNMCNLASCIQYKLNFPKVNFKILCQQVLNFTSLQPIHFVFASPCVSCASFHPVEPLITEPIISMATTAYKKLVVFQKDVTTIFFFNISCLTHKTSKSVEIHP